MQVWGHMACTDQSMPAQYCTTTVRTGLNESISLNAELSTRWMGTYILMLEYLHTYIRAPKRIA